jgi:hypothetical protein
MEHETVVPHDVELLAVALDELDDTSDRRHGPVDVRPFERQDGPPHQGRSQCSGRAMQCFPFGHEPSVAPLWRTGAACSAITWSHARIR